LAECVPLTANDQQGLLAFARKKQMDLIVVGPEQPLAEGIVDMFRGSGLAVFGPTKNAARLEWSKAFAKTFMRRHNIPTAASRAFTGDQIESAGDFVRASAFPIVLKADGLAAGKGVAICETESEALAALAMLSTEQSFGSAGETILIEEFMRGEEASIFAVCDGRDYILLAPAQDHKRALDDDRGKNTGGMGAYAPAPIVTSEILTAVERTIIIPTLNGMEAEGTPYTGCLYVGIMITTDGPKVVEFNSRFGDPEAQVILPLCDIDFVEVLLSSVQGNLGRIKRLHPRPLSVGSAVCVVLSSAGYPDSYQTGHEIRGLENLPAGVTAFHAGTKRVDDRLLTSGGRVLGITAVSSKVDLGKTMHLAYDGVRCVSFEGMHFRKDIGRKAFIERQLA
jgi:phosphoribosylamine--glycine ligase